ncbi:hypothetical protein KC19_4G105700 [Ceratodon purpureus]|uniref:Transducin/WD40 repeat-like superfamily protein n=1 Tax=Ceratodon purpureus TaxID=3225 RepID=A0A8T0I966_CERPU|nr:hypothetical protein KC19_4G105700 [Ceratodon purpureus]
MNIACSAEFDALTGCKLSSIDIGATVVRMAYSPAGGHVIVAVLEDWTIRSWDLDTEHTYVLYSPADRKSENSGGGSIEVHIALTPLKPWIFFAAHRRLSVNVVGTVEGVKAATKVKMDMKKPIMQLACHPRQPHLYVAYHEGVIRAYNITNFAVLYTLQIEPTVKLAGAGAFAFHPTLEWVFVGDRCGTLLAWDVSVQSRPNLIGIVSTGTSPIVSVSWLSMLNMLVTLTKEGTVHVWRARVNSDPNKPHMRANFLEPAGVDPLDISTILSQGGGGPVYPLPRIIDILVHPKLNLASLLFANVAASAEETRRRGGAVSREQRRQLFSVLQAARGSPSSVLKEKLAVLGSTGILPDHQTQLQYAKSQAAGQLTISDLARKAFLYGNGTEGQAKSGPILSLPLLTIADPGHPLRDMPVCQPFQQPMKFYNSENRIFNYPVRAFLMDGCNLTAYNLASGDYNIYKKLSPTALGGNERTPKRMLCSSKQHMFLIFFECRGATSEVVVYRDNLGPVQAAKDRVNTITGSDGAFIGPTQNQYAILEDDGVGLVLYSIEEEKDLATLTDPTPAAVPTPETADSRGPDGALDENDFSEASTKRPLDKKGSHGPVQFAFDTPVQRIFSCPLEATLLYVCPESHIGLGKVYPGAYTTTGELLVSTSPELGRLIQLQPFEVVLEVQWQETLSGQVAGILTTQRVLIASASLSILASTSATPDRGYPPFRSLLWVGPSLLYSTATSVMMLGWDGVARPLARIGTPNAALVGALNDRLLLACSNDPNPRQKQGVEIKTRLVGLLEPLVVGWTTMQKAFEPKLDLLEIMYQLTSSFDSLRVTSHTLDALASGPTVCAELAVELAQAGPQFTQELRCNYAIKACKFTTALSILKDEFIRSRDYPRCPPTTRLFLRIQGLGRACINYAQFDMAKETFEVVSDYQSMLDLFICHLNPSALRILVHRLEREGTNPELQRQCEKILSIRSAGWGQGMFKNFAAESMMPKGPEWAGGNWEIRSQSDGKKAIDWELNNEVTAYMKTPNGPIPTITPDHIGVYLGTLRGRGTVVEVREDMLAVFGANGNKEPTPGAAAQMEMALVPTQAPSPRPQTGGQPVTEVDLQARAAEEFAKGLKTADDDSSDDEGAASKTTKPKFRIQINAKPTGGSTVDAQLLRAATQQFKIGDGLVPGRPSISRPPQDPFLPLAPPAPASVMGSQQPPMFMQPEVAPGQSSAPAPIPEDFFQNTTNAVAVAKTFEKTGTLLPQPHPQAIPPSTGGPAQISYELPGGGVPPQASETATSTLSLPGGGVPPQAPQTMTATEIVAANLNALDASLDPKKKQEQQQKLLLDLVGGPKPQAPAPVAPSTAFVKRNQIPRGEPAALCFKAGLAYIEQNQLKEAILCLDEAFLGLAKERSLGTDVKPQARIIAQYKVAVQLLQEISRLQKVDGLGSAGAQEMARLSRHLSSLPLQAKHRFICIRTAIKRNMDVQNYAYSKKMLELLLSKAPANKQDELRAMINVCVQRGLVDHTIEGEEDPSQFCAATLSRLSTIGHDSCNVCGSKFSALATPGCTICGMGTVQRSDAVAGGPVSSSPFG